MNKTETQKRIDTAKENLASENIEQFPSVFQMARNLAKQAWLSGKGAVVGQGFLTTAEKAHSRLTICESCEFYRDSRCLKCGCFMDKKVHLEAATCPVDKWGENTGIKSVAQIPTPNFDLSKFPENERIELENLAKQAVSDGTGTPINPKVFSYKDIQYKAYRDDHGTIHIGLYIPKLSIVDPMTENEKRIFYMLVNKARALKEPFVYNNRQFFIEEMGNDNFKIRSKRLDGVMEP